MKNTANSRGIAAVFCSSPPRLRPPRPPGRRTRSRSACSRSVRRCRYFVALDLGYFKELNIEPELSTLMGGPPNVAALITNQIEVSAVLVTLEGLNADVKKPGVAMYVAMHSQNRDLQDGTVRRAFGPRRQGQDSGRFQGPEADVGAGSRQSEHRQRHSRQSRLEGRRLHHRPARHGPARQCDEGRHLRRRLYARAERHHHAQSRRRRTRSRPA